jgi:hypothetical protein
MINFYTFLQFTIVTICNFFDKVANLSIIHNVTNLVNTLT